jgi:hypothetical protein
MTPSGGRHNQTCPCRPEENAPALRRESARHARAQLPGSRATSLTLHVFLFSPNRYQDIVEPPAAALRRAIILPLGLISLLAVAAANGLTPSRRACPQARVRPQLERRQQAASPARRSS